MTRCVPFLAYRASFLHHSRTCNDVTGTYICNLDRSLVPATLLGHKTPSDQLHRCYCSRLSLP